MNKINLRNYIVNYGLSENKHSITTDKRQGIASISNKYGIIFCTPYFDEEELNFYHMDYNNNLLECQNYDIELSNDIDKNIKLYFDKLESFLKGLKRL